jgi:hypothetical protein
MQDDGLRNLLEDMETLKHTLIHRKTYRAL